MHKITCKVGTKTEIFHLANVKRDIKKVAAVLANNLSFDDEHTPPVVSSTSKANTPFFDYCGVETLTLEPEEQFKYRDSLHRQGFLTGTIDTFGDEERGVYTTLYKFKVLER